MASCTVVGQSSPRITSKVNSIAVSHLRNAYSRFGELGPFEGNTSHPILLVGNTAGKPTSDSCYSDLVITISPDPVTPLWA